MEVKSKVGLFIFFGLMYGAGRAMAGAHSILHEAARTGNVADVQWLVNVGVPVDAAENGGTALHEASSAGHANVAQLLIDAGAGVNVVDRDGETALHKAARGGHEKVAQLLIQFGAEVDATSKKNATDDESTDDESTDYDEDRNTPLLLAASGGREAVARLLIDAGADLNARNSSREAPLHYAAAYGHEGIIKLLIEDNTRTLLLGLSAHIDSENKYRETPLHKAASAGHANVAQLLIDAGADVNVVDRDGETALHEAAYCGHVNIARLLLEIGADVNAVDDGGWTSLHKAAANGHEEVAQLLIQFGAEVNATNKKSTADDESTDDESVDDESTDYDEYRNTPLNEAARNDHWNLVQLLLQANANPNAKDDDGEAPLHHAVACGQESVIKLLIDYGADVDVVANWDGYTPLCRAVETRRAEAELVRLLISVGADVNKRIIYDSGDGPLHMAASRENVEIAQLLIDAGADVDARDEMGQTPLHYAAGLVSEAKPVVARLLLDHGARVDATDCHGSTPLYHAVNRSSNLNSVGAARVAQLLVERGADIRKAYGYYEEAPLICAIKRGNEWFARLLVKQGEDIKAKNRQGQIALDLCSERLRRELQEISDARQNAVQQWATQLERELLPDVVRSVILPLALPSRAAQEVVQQMGSRIRLSAQALDSRPRKKQRHS